MKIMCFNTCDILSCIFDIEVKYIPFDVETECNTKTVVRIAPATSISTKRIIEIKNLFLQYHGCFNETLHKNIFENSRSNKKQIKAYSLLL